MNNLFNILHVEHPDEWHDLLDSAVNEIIDSLDISPEIIVFGKKCKQNRDVGFFSDCTNGYNYRNTQTKSKPLTPALKQILAYINTLTLSNYNGILINRYNSGSDYIGAHSDDVNGLDPVQGVVMISYGQIRTFRIREKVSKKIVANIQTEHCQILQMTNNMQVRYTHEIPMEKKRNGVRYSFTFRNHATKK